MSVATPTSDFSWLSGPVAYLLEAMGVGGFGLAWRGNALVSRLEAERQAQGSAIEALAKRADAHDADRAAIREALAALRESVARLPTRDEADRRFDELKQDYRARRD